MPHHHHPRLVTHHLATPTRRTEHQRQAGERHTPPGAAAACDTMTADETATPWTQTVGHDDQHTGVAPGADGESPRGPRPSDTTTLPGGIPAARCYHHGDHPRCAQGTGTLTTQRHEAVSRAPRQRCWPTWKLLAHLEADTGPGGEPGLAGTPETRPPPDRHGSNSLSGPWRSNLAATCSRAM
jgi:hypothetical protein